MKHFKNYMYFNINYILLLFLSDITQLSGNTIF